MNLLKIFFLSLITAYTAGCTFTSSGNRVQNKTDIHEKKAAAAEEKGDYSNAVKIYLDLLSSPESLPACKELYYRRKLKDLFLEQARRLYWKSKMENSPAACRSAVLASVRAKRIYPDAEEECDMITDRLIKWFAVLNNNHKSDVIKLKSDIKDDDIKLRVLCRQGEEYLKNGRYDFAVEKFQDAVLVDPFYPEALKGLNSARKLKEEDRKKAEDEKIIQQEIEEAYRKAVEEKKSVQIFDRKKGKQ